VCVGSELNRVINCLHAPFKARCNAEAAGLIRTFLQKQLGRFRCTFGEYYTVVRNRHETKASQKSQMQWSNYEGARGGLAPLKDRVAPSKHLV